MVTQQVAPSIKKKTFVRPCRQIEGQNSFLSLPLVFHKFPIGLPTFFSCVHVWLFLTHRLKLLMAVCSLAQIN